MSRTVLIVDDHAPFRPWTRRLLEDERLEVTGAVRGSLAKHDLSGPAVRTLLGAA